MTNLLGVIGDPIAHSMSPLIHNGWLRDMGFNATYEAMHVPEGAFESALQTLSKRDILGVNVTLPHKHAALAASSEASAEATSIGAANTLSYLGQQKWRAGLCAGTVGISYLCFEPNNLESGGALQRTRQR